MVSLCLLGACADKEGDGGGVGGDGDGDGVCDDDQFGTVMVELQRSPNEAESPFIGTASIVVFLDYKECLADFYLNEAPQWQFDGVEGAAVKEEWMDGLCNADCYDKPVIPCSVTEIDQTLNTQGATDITIMRIRYDVDSGDIEGLHVPFGPLPTETLAGCSPLVSLGGASVQGFDDEDNCLWRIASFENPTARVGQGASIQIFAESCN